MDKWKKGVRRPCSVLWRYFTIYGHTSKYFKELFFCNYGLDKVKCIDHQTYLLIEEFDNLASFFEKKIEGNVNYFDIFFDVCLQKCEEHLKKCKNICAFNRLQLFSQELIINKFDEYVNSNLSTIPVRYGYFIVDKYLQTLIEKKLTSSIKRITSKSLQEIIYPKELDFSTKEIKSLLNILAQCQSTPKINNILQADIDETTFIKTLDSYPEIIRLIDKHIGMFAWIGCVRYIGAPYNKNDVAKMIIEKSNLDASEEIKKINEDRIKRIEYCEIFKKQSNNDKENYLLDTFIKYAFLRNYRMDIFYIADYHVRPLLIEIAKRLEIDWEYLICLSAEEIRTFLLDNSVINLDTIKLRKDHFDMYLDSNKIIISTDKISKKQNIDQNRLRKKLTGQIASRGLETGRACIVKSKYDNSKIQKGDIVVSPMTTPDMNLALKRAKAIVTDEGGMLSHAAQYSREIGIPSVVGTEIATQTIIAGDKIEVDAQSSDDDGIITILELVNSMGELNNE